MSGEEIRLREIIAKIYADRDDSILVSPSWLASEAMRHLDPEMESEPTIYLAANLQFRQVARSVLGRKFASDQAESDDQHPLFHGLQRRYPIPHPNGEEPQYKLLEHLTEAEVAFNVARLRHEAVAKRAHADKLETWGLDHFRAGAA